MVFKFFRRILPRRTVSLSQQTFATLWKLQGILNKPTDSELIEYLTACAAKQHGLDNFDSDLLDGGTSTIMPLDGDAKFPYPSVVNFVLFRSSYLENVPPIEASIEGKRFEIEYWNEVVFAVIKFLIENRDVTVHQIAKVLDPNVKVGSHDGYKPIKGLNLSYNNIRTPRVSWECIEKLNLFSNIDVRIRFKWNEKAKVKLRELSYEIRTLPINLDSQTE